MSRLDRSVPELHRLFPMQRIATWALIYSFMLSNLFAMPANAHRCVELFLANQSSPETYPAPLIRSWSNVVDSWRAQSSGWRGMLGVAKPWTETKLRIEGPTKEVVDKIAGHLEVWSRNPESEFTSESAVVLRKLTDFVLMLKNKDSLSVDQLLILTRSFSMLASVRKDLWPDIEKNFERLGTGARSPGDYIKNMPERVEHILNSKKFYDPNYHGEIVLPTGRNLGFSTILDGLANDVHLVGIATTMKWIDGIPMLPEEVTFHDFLHAQNISIQKRDKSARQRSARIEQQREFRGRLKEFAFNRVDSRMTRLMEAIQFGAFHEFSSPMNPKSFLDFLTILQSPTPGYSHVRQDIISRFQDQTDLGQAFRPLPTEQEIRQAVVELKKFVSALK